MPLPSTISPPVPNFDMLMALYRDDREAFESLRRQLLQDAVDAAPADRRPLLNKLVENIEATRTAAHTPEQAASQAFKMMAESLQELRHSWQQASQALSELQYRLLIEKIRQ